MNKRNCMALLPLLTVFTLDSAALETSFSVSAGASHTDNSLKSSDDTNQSELEQSVDANIGLSHSGKSVKADIGYVFSRIEYDKETQDDETITTGDASITYEQIEQTLIWNLDNSRRSVVRDRGLVDIESNRDEQSVTTAKGTYILHPSETDTVSTSISYSDIRYDDQDQQDSDRTGITAVWNRQLTQVDSLSLNLGFDDVSFENSVSDYEYYSATVGYQAVLSRLSYQIQVGYNEQESDSRNNTGGLLRANFNYSYGGSNWSLDLSRQLTDTSRGNNNNSISNLDQFSSFSNSDVLELTSADFTYSNTTLCESCTVALSVLLDQERYEVLDDDNDQVAARVQFAYQLSRTTSLSSNADYREFSFKGANTRNDYNIVSYGFSLSKDITQDLSISLSVNYEDKESDLSLEDYDELRGGISLNYQFL